MTRVRTFLGVVRYELKMQLRSPVFWLAFAICLAMFYTEIFDWVRGIPLALQRANEGMVRNPGFIYELVQRPLSNSVGPVLADRMAIVMSFTQAFVLSFVFDRDRVSKSKDVVMSRAVSSWEYVLGKYTAVISLYTVLFTALLVSSILITSRVALDVGSTVAYGDFIRPALYLLLPTMLYAGAVVLVLANLFPTATSVIPVYVVYFLVSLVGIRLKGGNSHFGLLTFVIRSDGYGPYTRLLTEQINELLANRLLHGGLTLVFLVSAVWLYEKGRRGNCPGRQSGV